MLRWAGDFSVEPQRAFCDHACIIVFRRIQGGTLYRPLRYRPFREKYQKPIETFTRIPGVAVRIANSLYQQWCTDASHTGPSYPL